MFFIAYAFKGQVHVFAGQVKVVSHSSCKTSAIFKYFCPLSMMRVYTHNMFWLSKVNEFTVILCCIFRLTLGSPAKSVRTPIALRNNLKLANLRRSPALKTSPQPVKLDLDKLASMPELPDTTSTLPECHFVAKPLSSAEVQDEWKAMTLTK